MYEHLKGTNSSHSRDVLGHDVIVPSVLRSMLLESLIWSSPDKTAEVEP